MKNTILFALSFILVFSAELTAQYAPLSIEQEVLAANDTVRGTLLSPLDLADKKLKRHPLVIIIPGSGPTDRNGNSLMIPGPNDAYKQLADSLLKAGIASFRYDKPGVGQSSFSKSESELRFEDNVTVVTSITEKMRALGFKKIFLLGHSEGSLSAFLAAQQVKTAGVISMAGMGRNLHDILVSQLKLQLNGEMLENTLADLDSIKQGHTVKDYNPLLASLLRPSVQPYLQSAFAYEPTREIAKLKTAVLILQGGHDSQVPKEDAEALSQAQPKASYHFYPGMNHVLKTTDGSPKQNQAAYMDPDFPLHRAMLSDLTDWILEKTD